jgi:hypothetical protein
LISLIYGGDFNLFRPKVDRDHEEYYLAVVMEMYHFFGPFPASITEIAGEETCQGIAWLMQEIPHEKLTPIFCITEREVRKEGQGVHSQDHEA